MAKRIETIAEMLAHGSVVSWNMRDTPTRAHGKYAIRLELTFLDGATQRRELSLIHISEPTRPY